MMTEQDLSLFIMGALNADIVAVDTEASGQEIRDGRGYCIGISMSYRFGGKQVGVYLPFRHRRGNLPKEYLERLQPIFNHKPLIFHNAKFDLVSLETLGLKVPEEFYDTMLMAHMINENWLSKGLDWLGNTLLKEGKKDQKIVQQIAKASGGWDGVGPEIMGPYAKQDAEITLRLYEYLKPQFDKQGFGPLWSTEQRFVRLLAKMESRGIRVDTSECSLQAQRGRLIMETIASELGLNPGSPKDLERLLLTELGLPVYKTTPGGKPSFDKFAMAMYERDLELLENPTAGRIKEYRGWSKACAVAYEGYPALISPDGRLRPNYKMHGTVTGRLSCEKPNLQQIPRVSQNSWDGALKRLFIPADGYELWEADYSQLELRLGAAYAGERSLLEEFSKADSDVFSRMASELGFSRGDTKTLTYTLQYGGGIKRLSDVFKVDASRADAIRSQYFETYPGFKRLPQQAASKAKSRGYVKMWTGRRRHFENPEEEAHKAFNAIIQGGSAEIVKRTMLRLSDTVDGDDCRMLLQVHDSVVFEIRKDRVAEYKERIKATMDDVNTTCGRDFGVHFAVQIKRWGAD